MNRGDICAYILCCAMAAVLFIALVDGLPYGYFLFLRFFICIGSITLMIYLSQSSYEGDYYREDKFQAFYYLMWVAIIFNPVYQAHFERATWVILDIIVGSLLVLCVLEYAVYIPYKKRKEKKEEDRRHIEWVKEREARRIEKESRISPDDWDEDGRPVSKEAAQRIAAKIRSLKINKDT